MKLRVYILLSFLCVGGFSYGQLDLDSLLSVWNDPKQSTSDRIQSFNEYIWNGYLFSHPDSAITLAEELIAFSLDHGALKGAAIGNNQIGIAISMLGDDNRALDYFLESLRLNEELKDSQGIANCLNGIGLLYQNQGDKTNALDYFNRSIELRKAIGFKDGTPATLLNIGTIYAGDDREKAAEYFNRSLSIAQEQNDDRGAARALGNLGNLYLDPATADQALDYYKQSNTLFEKLGDEVGVINNLHNIGLIYQRQGHHTRAVNYCREAYERASLIDALHEEKLGCTCLYGSYKALGATDLALKYLERLQEIDRTLDANKSADKLLQMESERKHLRDSLRQLEADRIVQLDHEAALRNKNYQRNAVIITGLVLLLLIWGLYGRWKKAVAEKDLTEEKIDRVLQYEQLRKLDTIMEGQEMERKRIFEDLHDKLGGKFNALRYTWSSLFTEELESGTDKGKDLQNLDNIIQSLSEEIRQIVKGNAYSYQTDFGLKDSLEELKYLVQSAHQMDVNVMAYGIDGIPKTVALELYKVVLELVGNALKYSKGSHINVHLNQVEHHATLIVEDDGIGFDTANIRSGMGLRNIRSRAERLGGVVEIDSTIGKGTTVIVELDV